MFSREDILKQLRDGADPQDIATAMADAINGAIKDYEDEQARAQADTRNAERKADARVLIDNMAAFFQKWCGEGEMSEAERDQAADAICEITDHLMELDAFFKTLGAAPSGHRAAKAHDCECGHCAPSAEQDIDDDALRAFLKMFN